MLLVGILQRVEQVRLGQDAGEPGARVEAEHIGRLGGAQPGLDDRALVLGADRLALHIDVGVLGLEVLDDRLGFRLELGGLLDAHEVADHRRAPFF